MKTENKKAYRSPQLATLGTVKQITQGDGLGIRDFFVYGISDVIGNCRNDSCNTGS